MRYGGFNTLGGGITLSFIGNKHFITATTEGELVLGKVSEDGFRLVELDKQLLLPEEYATEVKKHESNILISTSKGRLLLYDSNFLTNEERFGVMHHSLDLSRSNIRFNSFAITDRGLIVLGGNQGKVYISKLGSAEVQAYELPYYYKGYNVTDIEFFSNQIIFACGHIIAFHITDLPFFLSHSYTIDSNTLSGNTKTNMWLEKGETIEDAIWVQTLAKHKNELYAFYYQKGIVKVFDKDLQEIRKEQDTGLKNEYPQTKAMGDCFLIGTEGKLIAWNTKTGKEAFALRHHNTESKVYAYAASPNGKHIVTHTRNGKIYLWSRNDISPPQTPPVTIEADTSASEEISNYAKKFPNRLELPTIRFLPNSIEIHSDSEEVYQNMVDSLAQLLIDNKDISIKLHGHTDGGRRRVRRLEERKKFEEEQHRISNLRVLKVKKDIQYAAKGKVIDARIEAVAHGNKRYKYGTPEKHDPRDRRVEVEIIRKKPAPMNKGRPIHKRKRVGR